jgi:hypothetical protein
MSCSLISASVDIPATPLWWTGSRVKYFSAFARKMLVLKILKKSNQENYIKITSNFDHPMVILFKKFRFMSKQY